MIQHSIAGVVSSFGGCLNGRDLVEISVRIAKEESVTRRAPSSPVDLEINKGFSRHAHEGNLTADQKSRHWQRQFSWSLQFEEVCIIVEDLWAKFCEQALPEIFGIPTNANLQSVFGKLQAGLGWCLGVNPFCQPSGFFTHLFAGRVRFFHRVFHERRAGTIGINVVVRALQEEA